jgi:RNA polymerase sigma-70 factor (ECF subfamily)
MVKDDQQLISETINGSVDAFDLLMQRYEKLVYRVAYGFGKTRDNALDITQNVFLKTYENLRLIRQESSFKGWLMRIVYNEGINWTRKNRFSAESDIIDSETEPVDLSPTQEDEMLAREHRSQLIRSLFALNTKHRLAVVLRYFEDQSIAEIAAIIGCSEGVVKNMLFRSLRRLKQNLQVSNSGEFHENLQ